MASFAAVNAATESAKPDEAPATPTTPTTPTARSHSVKPAQQPTSHPRSNPTTPTKHDFAGLPGQRALPLDPITPSRAHDDEKETDSPSRPDTSNRSSAIIEDVEMADGDDDDMSDNDSVTSDSQRPTKKKKGQRFFCTEFPPCQLSFTRSEHLARHIRKHTGERPFQCHCSRRFSRLDNLRQHAQTVHVNEEIPGDSLAATSTRFQRQIRTDRVRPPGSRSRASTLGSQGGHSRGHSRNLSSSSIVSNASSVSNAEDVRRRPQPLAMANDATARARLALNTLDSVNATPRFAYYSHSPTGYSTPTSATYTNGPASPSPSSALASPTSVVAPLSHFHVSRQTPTRRLSVPSGANPFQQSSSNSFPQPYFSPIHSGTSTTFSQSGSVLGSPNGYTPSHGRTESESEIDFRRRTWHPGTVSNTYSQRPATSGLTYQQTPDDQRPTTSSQPAANQVTRLPGIESFDHAARQLPSPMAVDARPVSSGRPVDTGLHHNLTRLDITAANSPVENQWQLAPPQVHPPPPGPTGFSRPPGAPRFVRHQHSASMPDPPTTPYRAKRQGWYGGPLASQGVALPSYIQRTSPEDSGSSDGAPTPSTSHISEYHPIIANPVGAPEHVASSHGLADEQKTPQNHHAPTFRNVDPNQPLPPSQQTYALQAGRDPFRFTSYPNQPSSNHDMGRLEALVAVATSEGRAAEQRS